MPSEQKQDKQGFALLYSAFMGVARGLVGFPLE
jgi:hypothetical protein